MAKSQNNKFTAVAKVVTVNQIAAPTTQAELPATLEQLKSLLAAKKGVTDETVSLEISYNGKQIKNVTSVVELMEISASIDARYNAYNQALMRHNATTLNIAPWSQGEKSYEEWMAVINKGLTELINKTEIANLEETIKDLEDCLSSQDKLAAKMAKAMARTQVSLK